MEKKRILIACEFSGIVRKAFRKQGHYAWSCDILPAEDNGEHFQQDILEVIDYGWDMMIAFPPCTHLAISGSKWFKDKKTEQANAINFFMKLVHAPIRQIAIENPVGIMSTKYRKPDQIIQPWQFGEDASKRTCLWLKNLPLLKATKIIRKTRYSNQTPSGQNNLSPSVNRGKIRGRTYRGIAEAMSKQWINGIK